MKRIAALDAQYADASTALAKAQARADEITRKLAKNPTDTAVLQQLRVARADIDDAKEQITALDGIREEVAALDEADRVAAWAQEHADTIAEIHTRAEARIKKLAKPIDDAMDQLQAAIRAWAEEGDRIQALTKLSVSARQVDLSQMMVLLPSVYEYARGEIAHAVCRGVSSALSAINTDGIVSFPGMVTGSGHTASVEDCARVSAEQLRYRLRVDD